MKALVIYDSVFGNTEQIAQAMGAALGAAQTVETVKVSDVTPRQLSGVQLLIVGSPTRQFRATPAMMDFLKGIPPDGLKGVKAAAFDTRLTLSQIGSPVLRFIVNQGGYAAKRINAALKAKGAEMVAPGEGFLVSGEKGPLEAGECERAAAWAKRCLSGW